MFVENNKIIFCKNEERECGRRGGGLIFYYGGEKVHFWVDMVGCLDVYYKKITVRVGHPFFSK